MGSPPTPRERRIPVDYLRETEPKRPGGDWRIEPDRFTTVARGVISLKKRAGSETTVADGIDSIQKFEAWDDYKHGIRTTDCLKASDGRIFNIESADDWEQRGRYLEMTLVENKHG